MKLAKFFLLGLLILIGYHHPLYAQGEGTPLFFLMNGDIWSYTPSSGEILQKTTWGYNERPVMSPDGNRFAYLSLATIAAEAARNSENFFLVNSNSPMNVWIWDIAVNDAVRIADQPANIIMTDGFFQNYILRRSLAWSPDGTQLTWIEIDQDFRFQLVVYDFASETARTLSTDIPLPYADAGMIGDQPMQWGVGGIALETMAVAENPDPSTGTFHQTISLYDPASGNLIARTIIGKDDRMSADWVWLDRGQIALFYPNGEQQLLSPESGKISPMTSGSIELYSADANTTTQLVMGKFVSEGVLSWEILWANGQPQTILMQGLILDRIAVSPSGNNIAFIDNDLNVWIDGQIIPVPGTGSLGQDYLTGIAWGAPRWRIVGEGISMDDCGHTPAPRLQIGGRGIVIGGLGNNALRDTPGQSAVGSNEIGIIPPNGEFNVLAGPVCASGFYWWQVNYNGQVGWTAEGEGQTYWLEPR